MKFMNEDFLLQTKTAKELYHNYAENLPIIDYHCHILPAQIAEDTLYENITQVMLYGDHYKWRAMRLAGVDEKFITGDAPDYDRFLAFAKILPSLIGNPLYHWTHLELKRYFDVEIPLCEATAKEIFEVCNEKLKTLSVREMIRRSKVQVICTTDDPDDSLEFHRRIAQSDFECRVLPTFRPDRLLKNPNNLTQSTLLKHIEKRLDFFVESGCKLSDHAVESFSMDNELLLEVAKLYKERKITMQLHYGVLRNTNRLMLDKLGADTGFDCIGDSQNAKGLVEFLDRLDRADRLPKTILYSVNPNDNAMLGTVIGCFRNVQQGAAWWFNDTKFGMEQHLSQLAALAPLGKFIGMLTDSRSFLSYTRHEYFRRILCNYIGGLVENGEYPSDTVSLGKLITDISYENAKRFLEL